MSKVLKAIVVDDERLARLNLINLLESHNEIRIVAEANSCESAINMLDKHKPDLIFLDIQLSGETGFDMLDKINSDIKIVFVTAYEEYAIRAFEINAVDYLLKPINPDRLTDTVARLTNREIQHEQEVQRFSYKDSVFVKLNSSTSKFIHISSIVCLEPVGNHSKIKLDNNTSCLVLKTLKQWIKELPEENFVQIHRSSIVNIGCIERIERYSVKYHRLYLQNIAEPLEISRRYLSNLKAKYQI